MYESGRGAVTGYNSDGEKLSDGRRAWNTAVTIAAVLPVTKALRSGARVEGAIAAKTTLALPAPRQVAANWGVNTYKHGGEMYAIEHIMYRHASNSGFANVSRFAEGTGARQIQGMVDDALRYGTQTGAGTFEYNLGRVIGTNQGGGAATGIRVHIRDGNIQTAFPITIP